MKARALVFGLLLLVPLVLSAQDMERIKADPSFLWAEGVGVRRSSADDAALSGLVDKLAATEELPLDQSVRRAVWRTYFADIRNKSGLIVSPSGLAFRYLAWKDIPSVFENRWRKTRELIQSAETAALRGELDVARTYCSWAEVYLASLPSGEESLRQRAKALRNGLGEGNSSAVQLRNVESEVAAIRQALGFRERRTTTASKQIAKKEESPAPLLTEHTRVPSERIPDMLQFKMASPCRLETLSKVSLAPVNVSSRTVNSSKMEEVVKWRVSALAELGRVPAYGVQLAWTPGRWGGYVSFRSSFSQIVPAYSCLSDGTTDFGYLWTSGKARGGRHAGSAGVVLQLSDFFSVFAGGGYAESSVWWEDSAGRWALVSDLSVRGLSAECGMSASFRHLCFMVGVSSIRIKDFTTLLGLGWAF